MRALFSLNLLALLLVLFACQPKETKSPGFSNVEPQNEEVKIALDSLVNHSTYLPVYAQIYQQNEKRTYDLTVLASFRNVSLQDTLVITAAKYFDTKGNLIRNYQTAPVSVLPLQTIEIVVSEQDNHGGTGANFIIEWAKRPNQTDLFCQALMISTTGQQGISFTTEGVEVQRP